MPAPLVLIGPTASGKSALAMAVAEACGDIELVSADSMQVYRGMDIGTAKPTADEQARVRHHLIDIADPHDDYAVSRFQADAQAAFADIEARGKRAIMVGGTGLYVQAVVNSLDIPETFPEIRAELDANHNVAALHQQLTELDPLAASRMEPTNHRRIARALEVTLGSGRPFSSFGPGIDAYPEVDFKQIGIRLPREVQNERIDRRYEQQMADGFLDEVKGLLALPNGISRTARQALGYKELIDHIEARRSLGGALELARSRTRKFARRQERWFNRDPRIHWLEAPENPMALLDQLLRELPS